MSKDNRKSKHKYNLREKKKNRNRSYSRAESSDSESDSDYSSGDEYTHNDEFDMKEYRNFLAKIFPSKEYLSGFEPSLSRAKKSSCLLKSYIQKAKKPLNSFKQFFPYSLYAYRITSVSVLDIKL